MGAVEKDGTATARSRKGAARDGHRYSDNLKRSILKPIKSRKHPIPNHRDVTAAPHAEALHCSSVAAHPWAAVTAVVSGGPVPEGRAVPFRNNKLKRLENGQTGWPRNLPVTAYANVVGMTNV